MPVYSVLLDILNYIMRYYYLLKSLQIQYRQASVWKTGFNKCLLWHIFSVQLTKLSHLTNKSEQQAFLIVSSDAHNGESYI